MWGVEQLTWEVQGTRRRGRRPKRRWMDCTREDPREKQLSEDDVYDRAWWRRERDCVVDAVEEKRKAYRKMLQRNVPEEVKE